MTTINDGITLPCGMWLTNRLVKAPMSENLADEFGSVTGRHLNLYRSWARKSHCGLLVTGNIQVDRRFLERSGNICVDKDFPMTQQQMEMLSLLAAAGKNATVGTKVFAQLGHAGLQSVPAVAKLVPGPSMRKGGTARSPGFELTVNQINEIVDRFAFTASEVQVAGFDGLEIHAAHGYLLSSFMNPRKNKRKDEYGGSLANRSRFLLDVVRAVKEATSGDAPFGIGVKINASDFQEGGFTVDDCAQVALWLQDAGVDLIELSGGNYEAMAMIARDSAKDEETQNEAFFSDFSLMVMRRLKEHKDGKKLVVMLSGGFRSRAGMEEAINAEATDLIGIGRPLCCNTRCTQDLLNKTRESLPDPDVIWDFPWYLGRSMLHKMWSSAQTARAGMVVFACFRQQFFMSESDSDPDGEANPPDIVSATWWFTTVEKRHPLELKGFKKDDIYVQEAILAKL